MVGQLKPRAPFSFAHALSFLRRFPPTEGERPIVGDAVLGAMRIKGRTLGFRVGADGSVETPSLRCSLMADDLRPDDVETALVRIGGWLGIEDDLVPFYALARHDPPFASVVQELYGYHQVRFFTPFENTCWAILGQRTPMAAARRAKRGLMLRFGGSCVVDGVSCMAFPESDDLAGAGLTELGEIVGSERKAERLLAVSWAFAEAEPAFLHSAPTEQLAAWLGSLRGIGAWSTTFILLRGFGRADAPLPLGTTETFDRELLQAARSVYGDDLTPTRLAEIAEQYGPWRGYWGHYLRSREAGES